MCPSRIVSFCFCAWLRTKFYHRRLCARLPFEHELSKIWNLCAQAKRLTNRSCSQVTCTFFSDTNTHELLTSGQVLNEACVTRLSPTRPSSTCLSRPLPLLLWGVFIFIFQGHARRRDGGSEGWGIRALLLERLFSLIFKLKLWSSTFTVNSTHTAPDKRSWRLSGKGGCFLKTHVLQ